MNLGYSIGVALLVAVALIVLSLALCDAERPLNSNTGGETSSDR